MRRLSTLLFLLAFSAQAKTAAKAVKEERAPVDEVRFNVLMKNSRGASELMAQLSQMESLRSSAEASLAALLKSRPGELELSLRQAELYIQRGRDFEQFSLELSLLNEEKKSVELHLASLSLFRKGLDKYQSLLSRVKNHPLEGDIFLGIARSQKSLAKLREALSTLKAIEGRTLATKTQMAVWLLRGDLEFALANPAGAHKAYVEAKKYVTAGSTEELYLTYKTGWALYNLKDTVAAVNELKKVIEASRDRLALASEAVQDFALFAADLDQSEREKLGDYSGIYSYLKKYSRTEIAEKSMEKLSDTYASNGRRKEAQDVLLYLIEQEKYSDRNGDRALTIVKLDHDLVDKKNLTKRYLWLISNFGPLSAWYKQQNLRPDIQRNTADAIEENLRTFAVNLHKEADNEQSAERRSGLEGTVAELYDAHLANFKDAPRIHYYRAEIYRRSNNFEQAARHYDQFIINLLATGEANAIEFDQKIKREAAIGAVQMWAKTIDKQPKLVELMLQSCDRFVLLFPKDEKSATVALDAAKVEFKSGQPEVALKRLQKIVADYPRTNEAADAVQAGLDILNKQNDFVNLAEYARAWREKVGEWAPDKKKEELRSDLDKILTTSEAKSCEEMSKNKNKKLEAALCFRRVADNNKEADIAPKSLILASDLFKEFGDPYSSLEALEVLVQRHPDSKQAGVAFSKLAEGFERNFQFVHAADTYEKLLTRKDVPNRKQIVERLAALYLGLSENAKLQKILSDKDAGATLKNQIFDKQLRSNFDELIQLERTSGYASGKFAAPRAQEIYTALRALEAQKKLPVHLTLELTRIQGHFEHSNKNLKKADEIWMANLKTFWKISPKTPELWEAAARTRLSQGSYWRSLFTTTDLANGQKKIALFQKIEVWNAEVLAMNSPAVALETLQSSAKLYRDFAEELKKNPQTTQMATEMLGRAKVITQELARRAQNWGLITPLLLETLRDLRHERGEKDSEIEISFPWPSLPRAHDLTIEKTNLSLWTLDKNDLEKKVRSGSDRREQRQAAFVLITKENSLKNVKLNGWEDLLTAKDEVQSRIMASVHDMALDKAELLLSQYELVYGDDRFTSLARVEMLVGRRDYSNAYRQAIGLFKESDFESKYYAIGWKSLFDELVEGKLSDDFKSEAFSALEGSAKKDWEKKLIAYLCLKGTLTCSGAYSGAGLLALVNSQSKQNLNDFVDHRSLWRIEKDFLELALPKLSQIVTKEDQSKQIQNGFSYYKTLEKTSTDRKAFRQSVDLVGRDLNAMEDRLVAMNQSNRQPAAKASN